jgi:alkylated DNA repair dioxygenase AlkB
MKPISDTPVTYFKNFVENPDDILNELWNGLDWENRDAPRREYFCSTIGDPYTYGKDAGRRTYHPKPWTPTLLAVKEKLELQTGIEFELLFLNGYANEHQSLHWHADNSPEMDDLRPIGIVSVGEEREIWFKRIGAGPDAVEGLKLGNGSLCLMAPGMQDTHLHRIPKGSRQMKPRVSFTFRGQARDQGI